MANARAACAPSNSFAELQGRGRDIVYRSCFCLGDADLAGLGSVKLAIGLTSSSGKNSV